MKPANYEDYRREQIEQAKVFQDFVCDCFLNILKIPISAYSSRVYQQEVGESASGIEIKNDRNFARTRNLYIEISEKARPRPGAYADSGIMRNDNTWLYVIGDFNTLFVFAKRLLIGLHRTRRYRVVENGTKTSIGFLLPERDAVKYAAQILTPNAETKIAKSILDAHQLTCEAYRSMLEGDTSQMYLFEMASDTDENP